MHNNRNKSYSDDYLFFNEETRHYQLTAFIGGVIVDLVPSLVVDVALSPGVIEYNETENKYYVYCITNKACIFTVPDNVEVVKAAN